MKKLDTQFATTVVTQPLKAGSVDHIQQAYTEVICALALNMIGPGYQDNIIYILFGCVNTGTYPAVNISNGAVFYNNEVFLVDAFIATLTGSDVVVANEVTTFFTDISADPTVFSDTSSHNVHQIRKIVLSAGSTGSTIADFTAFKQTSIALANDQEATLPSSYVATFDQDRAVFFAAATADCDITFDLTNAIPGAVQRLKWTFGAGRALTITPGSGQTLVKDSGDLTLVASNTNVLYMIYVGKNDLGNDEISYVLTQTS